MKQLFSVFVLVASITLGAWSCASAQPVEPLSQAPQTTIPYKKEEAGNGATASRAFLTLLVLLGIAGVGLWVVKRYFPHWTANLPVSIKNPANRRVKVIESVRLNPKASLYLIEMDGRVLLLAQSGDNISLVDKGDAVKNFDRGA